MFAEKIYGVLAKIEATSGTDSVPTNVANAVRLVGIPTLNYDFLEDGNRDDVETGQLGVVDRTAPAGRFGSIDITLELRGAGAAYAAGVRPESDPFWRASGFSATGTFGAGTEQFKYTTLDSGFETLTLYCYGAGKLFRLVGCVAKPKFSAEANKRGFMTFAVMGRMVTDPAETALPALTLSAVMPPIFNGAANNIGTWLSSAGSDPLVLQRAEIDWQNETNDRPSAGATDGLIGFLITERKPRQTMVVEVGLLTSFDPYAAAKAIGGALPTSAWQVGTVQYNRVKVVTGRWALEKPAHGANKGLMTWTLTGSLAIGSEGTTNREAYVLFD